MSIDRGIPRKEQAKLARKLFRSLSLSGISVTTPSYSMAQAVDVTLPDCHISECCTPVDEKDACGICRDQVAIKRKIEEILGVAFPNHDNRSEMQSDYHDYCWSVN